MDSCFLSGWQVICRIGFQIPFCLSSSGAVGRTGITIGGKAPVSCSFSGQRVPLAGDACEEGRKEETGFGCHWNVALTGPKTESCHWKTFPHKSALRLKKKKKKSSWTSAVSKPVAQLREKKKKKKSMDAAFVLCVLRQKTRVYIKKKKNLNC